MSLLTWEFLTNFLHTPSHSSEAIYCHFCFHTLPVLCCSSVSYSLITYDQIITSHPAKKCYLISRVVSRLSIGLSLRRFAPKCANTFGTLKRLFSPMPDGSWYIWRMRWRHPSMAADYVMGIFDFTNAFNNLHRHDMLLAVIAVSELYSLLFRLQSPIHSVLRFIHHFVGGRVPIR